MKQIIIPGLKLFAICLGAALLLGIVNYATKGPIADAEKETVEKALNEMKIQGDRGPYLVAPPMEIPKSVLDTVVLKNISDSAARDAIKKLYREIDDMTYGLKRGMTKEDLIAAATAFTTVTSYKPKGPVRGLFVLKTDDKVSGFVLEIWGSGYGGDIKMFGVYDANGTVGDAQILKDAETPGLGKRAREPGYMDKYIGTAGNNIPVIKAMLKDPDAVTGATITFMGVADALRNGSRYIIMFGENE